MENLSLENIKFIILAAAIFFAAILGYVFCFFNFNRKYKNLESENIKLRSDNEYNINLNKNLEEKLNVLTDNEKYLIQEKTRLETSIFELEKRSEEFKNDRENHMNIARNAIHDIVNKTSNKLLEDYKRESNQTKKESEDNIKKLTSDWHEKFQAIFSSMDKIHSNINDLDNLRNALLTPASSGYHGELVLENILSASGLINKRDYFLQPVFTDEESTLKPDAIVLVPQNSAIIIDSKTSKFFIELIENPEQNIDLKKQLLGTIKTHLKDLVKRNYKKALENYQFKPSDNSYYSKNFSNITMCMFFPSDNMLEEINKIDSNFANKAWDEHIVPIGPSGLVSLLFLCSKQISDAMQIENLADIKKELILLLENTAKLSSDAEGIGRGLKQAYKNYDDFLKSFNSTFITRINNLNKLGVISSKKNTPTKIPRQKLIDVITGNGE